MSAWPDPDEAAPGGLATHQESLAVIATTNRGHVTARQQHWSFNEGAIYTPWTSVVE